MCCKKKKNEPCELSVLDLWSVPMRNFRRRDTNSRPAVAVGFFCFLSTHNNNAFFNDNNFFFFFCTVIIVRTR